MEVKSISETYPDETFTRGDDQFARIHNSRMRILHPSEISNAKLLGIVAMLTGVLGDLDVMGVTGYDPDSGDSGNFIVLEVPGAGNLTAAVAVPLVDKLVRDLQDVAEEFGVPVEVLDGLKKAVADFRGH